MRPVGVLYLVDGTFELFRCFHGAPRARGADGRDGPTGLDYPVADTARGRRRAGPPTMEVARMDDREDGEEKRSQEGSFHKRGSVETRERRSWAKRIRRPGGTAAAPHPAGIYARR